MSSELIHRQSTCYNVDGYTRQYLSTAWSTNQTEKTFWDYLTSKNITSWDQIVCGTRVNFVK